MMNTDKRKTELDILRIILTILVVLGHGSYYTIITRFGGIHYDQLMSNAGVCDTTFHFFLNHFHGWIYSFHMPAFFCLSGAVFGMEVMRHKYQSLRKLLAAKYKRLIIPLFFVWFIWNVPIKVISGYYDVADTLVRNILLQIIFPANVYLWFLEALFIITIFVYLLRKYISDVKIQFWVVVLLNIIGVTLNQYYRLDVPLGNPLRYVLWFWLGNNFEHITQLVLQYGLRLFRNKTLQLLVVGTAFYFGIYLVIQIFESRIWLVAEMVLAFLGILWSWALALMIAHTLSEKQSEIVQKSSGLTFGIYLWAEPVNYLFLYLVWQLLGIGFFGIETGAIFIFFIRVVGSVFIAIIITLLLKKTKFPIKAY